MHDAYDTVKAWEHAFNSGNVDAIASLYTDTAVLWGTLAQVLIQSRDDIASYFREAFGSGLRVRLLNHTTQRLSESMVNVAGRYDLTRNTDPATLLPARYSFVLIQQKEKSLIAHHHSSMLPSK